MLENYLDITFAGILASLNFAGYLTGSILSIVLGFSTNETYWIIAIIIAEFAGAMALIVGSAIVMSKLQIENKTKAMGIHFSGIVFSILTTDLINRYVLNTGFIGRFMERSSHLWHNFVNLFNIPLF